MNHADYIERIFHGSPDFPLEYYFIDEGHPRYIMRAHWHREFEIIRVLDGSLTVYLNNAPYLLHRGDILLIQGGCLHRAEPTGCIYECVVFDPVMLKRQKNDVTEKYLAPIITSQLHINNLAAQEDPQLQDTVNALFAVLGAQSEFYELEVYGLLFRLFSGLYVKKHMISVKKAMPSHQIQTVLRLVEWIERNFAEPISLDKLSELFGLNKKYLCRIFKAYTSKTVMEYVNELRIENACYDICVRGKNITEASYDSGFNDLSYFCKVFKQYKGMTPKEFKKTH